MKRIRILLTGASGYVGSRLLPELERSGFPVRCLVRRPEALPAGAPSTEVCRGDVRDENDLRKALQGIHTAFYLVHSMSSKGAFEEKDRLAAKRFGRAALESGVRKIIYLGGLGSGENLSPHLRSRQEVGRLLRESGVPTIELRASVVLGEGSLSFEMIRSLVERLPVMITPRWVRVRAQPIAIDDLLTILMKSVDLPLPCSRIVEIGGKERVSYAGLMKEYARQREIRRWMIPVPVLTPYLSSLWLGLVTPLIARVGRILIQSIVHETIVRDDKTEETFGIRPCGYSEAIRRALAREERAFQAGDMRAGRRLVETRTTPSRGPVPPFPAMGNLRALWQLRGLLDRMIGGPGIGWRIVDRTGNRRIRFESLMRLPGRAWLEYERNGKGLRQTAVFQPRGLAGLIYWYALLPIHMMVFSGMIREAAGAAERKT